ncbi:hypothetical protein BX616_004290, partial [Lobosporangium transversale]
PTFQQQQQLHPQQLQLQDQAQQSMAYYSHLQVPTMYGMSHCQGYLNNNHDDSNMPVSTQQQATNTNSDSDHSSLINIRRDSGIAHSSLDDLSIGSAPINSANQSPEGDLKGGAASSSLPSTHRSIDNSKNNNSTNNSTSPSYLLPSQSTSISTTDVEGSTPIVPSMSNRMDYMFNNMSRMLVVQPQQQRPVTSITTTTTATGLQGRTTPASSSNPDSWPFPPTSQTATVAQTTEGSPMSALYDIQQQPMAASQQQAIPQQGLIPSLQYDPRYGQPQRSQQQPRSPVHVMAESRMAQPSTPLFDAGFSKQPSLQWEQSPSFEPGHHHYSSSSASAVASPSMTAANDIVQTCQQGYFNYCPPSWGSMVSSPIESSSSSGSSTPLFASPPLSTYAYSELAAASCDSSRAASPSFPPVTATLTTVAYDAYLSERRTRRLESDKNNSSSLTIRSRKSSTSSNSSVGSQPYRRTSNLRETSNHNTLRMGPNTSSSSTSSSSSSHQCPKCGQCFAGLAVLARHIESIHDKLLWNCVGCKSNLSRRDAVTRHINLSPMDSICRAVGTIGQVKLTNGVEVHYEVSSYRAKPLEEVMSRMGKKIPTQLRKEIDRSKATMQMREAATAATTSMASASPESVAVPTLGNPSSLRDFS